MLFPKMGSCIDTLMAEGRFNHALQMERRKGKELSAELKTLEKKLEKVQRSTVEA